MWARVRIRMIWRPSMYARIKLIYHSHFARNVKCGSLQCKDGNRQPVPGFDQMSSKTIISIKGAEYECKWVDTYSFCFLFSLKLSANRSCIFDVISRTTSGAAISSDSTEHGLVRNGSPCGKNLICMNQTCVSLFPYIDQTKCPTNSNNVECYGQGVSQLKSQGNMNIGT